jgi:hypothetical protein
LNGKIYLPDDTTPEVVNLATKSVSTWAKAPTAATLACLVSWKNYILKFGGSTPPETKMVYKYDPSNNTWTTLPTTAPFDISDSGCITLPNDNVLITGSVYGSQKQFTEYNVTSNTWLPVILGTAAHDGSLPVLLGNRVFVISSNSRAPVEEYVIANRTISYAKTITFPNEYPIALAVAADWFYFLPGGCKGIK